MTISSIKPVGVKLDNLVKQHGVTLAVNSVSLEIKQGEFFSILGPSGSGKTTTLRLIAGFDAPDRGDVLIHGRSMRGVPPHLRPINMVFQHYALFPHLTIWQNVVFGLQMQSLTKHDIRDRGEAVLEMVHLEGKQHRMPNELSGGEQQRVALARALVNQPLVLLLDEPLGALDQNLRQSMREELKRIQERVGITFICVTHHQEEALALSDRVAVMNHGQIAQVGTPQDLYEAPTSLFVAGFVGLSNQLSGEIISMNETTCMINVPDLPPVEMEQPEHVSVGRDVTVVFRPERLNLTRDRSITNGPNCFPCTIQKANYSGGDFWYQVSLSPSIVWTLRQTNDGGIQEKFQAGEMAFICWSPRDGRVISS